MSDEKPGREDDARDAELTDEQLDRETPGVDDAAELEAAEDELAAEAEEDEDKVVADAGPAPRSDASPPTTTTTRTTTSRRPVPPRRAHGSRPAAREGTGTRSRAAAERAGPPRPARSGPSPGSSARWSPSCAR